MTVHLDLTDAEAGLVAFTLRRTRRDLEKKRVRLQERFGEEAELGGVDVKLTLTEQILRRLRHPEGAETR